MKNKFGRNLFIFINVIIMLLVIIVCLAPIIHVVFASISQPNEINNNVGLIYKPLGQITLKGYEIVLQNPDIIRGYGVTFLVVVLGSALSLLLTCMGAYALSRKNLYWKNTMMFVITFTMFFNGGMIPTYMVVSSLHLRDSFLALILPSAVSVFNLIVMRTSFMETPEALSESAKIDGAGHMTILFRIILPVSKATIAVILLFYAVSYWNSWLPALLYIKSRTLFPLQLILREIIVQSLSQSNTSTLFDTNQFDFYKPLVKYCTIVVATLPILCIYPFLQKYFTTGVMVGSIKG